MARRLNYNLLAWYLSALPLRATCADLALTLERYDGTDAEYRERLVAAVRALPGEAEWFAGLRAVCDVLQGDNPRFQPGLFQERATNDY